MKRFSSACRFEPRTNTYAKFFMRCTYELKLLKRQFFFHLIEAMLKQQQQQHEHKCFIAFLKNLI